LVLRPTTKVNGKFDVAKATLLSVVSVQRLDAALESARLTAALSVLSA